MLLHAVYQGVNRHNVHCASFSMGHNSLSIFFALVQSLVIDIKSTTKNKKKTLWYVYVRAQ